MSKYHLHNAGEEFLLEKAFKDNSFTITIGLYDSSTDELLDEDNLDAITTEPSGGNYARQTVTSDTGMTLEKDSNNWTIKTSDDVVFDVSGIDGEVDAYFTIVNFESDEAGDSSGSDNLFWTADLGQGVVLKREDQLVIRGIGIALD